MNGHKIHNATTKRITTKEIKEEDEYANASKKCIVYVYL